MTRANHVLPLLPPSPLPTHAHPRTHTHTPTHPHPHPHPHTHLPSSHPHHHHTPRQLFPVPPPTEESCSLAIYTPPTGYEPNVLDDFHYSETSEMIFQEASGDIDSEPSYLYDAELDGELIRKALSSPLFIQDREEPADRRQAHHSHEERLLSAQSFFAHARTERPVHELNSCQKRRSSREMENERIRILFERQRANPL